MLPLDAATLRAAFVNTTQRERSAIVLPALDRLDWGALDYLGWRDPKNPLAGHVIAEVDGRPVGILLRQAERSPRSAAQCSWCDDVQLPAPVIFFSAKRAGRAGRDGNTVGTLVCSGFECSANVRRQPPLAYLGFDLEAERQRRIGSLREHAADFARRVRDGA